MNNKEKYKEFCKEEKEMPIFTQSWWLDAVCGNDWDVELIEKDNQIIASMPYFIKKKMFYKIIKMPKLTQSMGPYIKYPQNQQSGIRLLYEKEVMTELINKLPSVGKFSQNFNYKITNWMPFYWSGFQQTTYYTYIIDNLNNLESIFSKFDYSKRKNIRKAENIVSLEYDIPSEVFYNHHKITLAKKGLQISYGRDLFERIYNEGYKNKSVKTFAAYDKEKQLHAAFFLVWDKLSSYNLISSIDPDYKIYGSSSLLIRELISYSSKVTKQFDFEGSMIPSVEKSIRKFGAIPKPYFHISKISSLSYHILQLYKNYINCS
jgi:lipid II:glycine glycyltransferase (peptidoglycan interpeptide bridge formation enzyme)